MWEDLNANGLRELGDAGMNGWTVELVDYDTETTVATAVTVGDDRDGDGAIDPMTEAGRYRFDGLAPGTYSTRLVIQPDWTQTAPLFDPLSDHPGIQIHTALYGTDFYTDLQNLEPVWDTQAWLDVNPSPWVWKMNDDYYNDVWVDMRGRIGGFNAAALIPYTPGGDPNTYWYIVGDSFPGGMAIEDDFYDLDVKIVEDPSALTWTVTAIPRYTIADYYVVGLDGTEYLVDDNWGPSHGPDDILTVTLDMPHVYVVTSDEVFSDVDFGAAGQGSLSGQVFEDINGNGIRDGVEAGLDGWAVDLQNVDTGEPIQTTTTASVDLNGNGAIDPQTESGLYFFDGLFPGTYRVREVVPAGWRQTTPFEAAAGRVFMYGEGDYLGDGEYGPTKIYELDPETGVIMSTVFGPELAAGEHFVDTLAVGQTSLFHLRTDMGQSILYELDLNTGAVLDSDVLGDQYAYLAYLDGLLYAYGGIGTRRIDVFDPDTDTLVDTLELAALGLSPLGDMAAAGDLGMLVLSESDVSDGIFAVVDPATGAVVRTTVHLDNKWMYRNGEVISYEWERDSDTAAMKHFDPFTGVELGETTWDRVGIAQGRAIAAQPSPGARRVAVLSSVALDDVSFGNNQPSPAVIGGRVINDLNGNGVQDVGEIGMDGQPVELQDLLGVTGQSTVTASVDLDGNGVIDPASESGWYSFTVAQANYLVHQVVPDGWQQTHPIGDHLVRPLAGEDISGIDFTRTQSAVITGRAFDDLDRDGREDLAEPGVAGWEVQLVDSASGAVVATQLTADVDTNGDGVIDPATEAGRFEFAGLLPGDYELRVTGQDGWLVTVGDGWSAVLSAGQSARVGVGIADSWQTFDPINDIIVDNEDDGVTQYAHIDPFGWYEGNFWLFTQAAPTHEMSYLRTDASATARFAVQFRPDLPQAGNYAVYAWWPTDSRYPATDTVPMRVVHDDGSDEFVVDQTVDLGGDSAIAEDWHSLGIFYFSTETDAYVMVESTGEVGVMADAVKFVLVPSPTAPITGRVFEDLNGNGVQDAGERGLNGRTVELVDAATGQVLVAQITQIADLNGDGVIDPTAESGLYDFLFLTPGDYDVRLVSATNWNATDPADAAHSVSIGYTVGQSFPGRDFGSRLIVDEWFSNVGPVGAIDPAYDLDDDGDVDAEDVAILIHDVLNTELGDTNLDGIVDGIDLAVMRTDFGRSPVGWSGGDLNGDRLVDSTDLAILRQTFGFVAPIAPIAPAAPFAPAAASQPQIDSTEASSVVSYVRLSAPAPVPASPPARTQRDELVSPRPVQLPSQPQPSASLSGTKPSELKSPPAARPAPPSGRASLGPARLTAPTLPSQAIRPSLAGGRAIEHRWLLADSDLNVLLEATPLVPLSI
ncbi:hypothetical protein LCGC14_0124790 [marine sediment metagenome]|uniref:Dockerin domain-containing protein n=1 Tax=marine sediment metagenome TaxID=412755 RepID=A0A0F9V9L8_9ZZZZ